MVRLGTDIVYIPRIQNLVDKFGQRFFNRVYTLAELQHCGYQKGQNRPSVERLAGRWAAKEAVVKALGTGWCGIGYTDVEVCRHNNGVPFIKLHNNAAMIVAGWETGVANEQSDSLTRPTATPQWQISLSHDGDYAIATAIFMVYP